MILRLCALPILVGLLWGCANRERVVLLPGPDGKVGKVVVQGHSGQITLDSAYAASEAAGAEVQAKKMSEAEVRHRYGAILGAMPKRPASFTLLFVFDKAQLAPESRGTIAAIVAEFSSRPAPELIVIGHTDKLGEAQYNDELSRKRAEAVRDLLVRENIPRENIEIQWRGDREPVSSAGRMDPKNRRVEVKIR